MSEPTCPRCGLEPFGVGEHCMCPIVLPVTPSEPIALLRREVDQDLVDYCERLLARARAGTIVGLVVAAEMPGGEFLIMRHGDFAVLPMVGELELVKHRLLSELNARLEGG